MKSLQVIVGGFYPFLTKVQLGPKSNQGELLNPHHTSNQSMVENGTSEHSSTAPLHLGLCRWCSGCPMGNGYLAIICLRQNLNFMNSHCRTNKADPSAFFYVRVM